VDLDPENPRLLNDCALILQYHLKRDLDDAVSMYEEAIQIAKDKLAQPDLTPSNRTEYSLALKDASNNLSKLNRILSKEKKKESQ